MTDYDNMPAGEEMDMLIAWQVFRQENFNHLPTVWEEGNTPDGKDGWAEFVCPRCRRSGTSLTRPCVQSYSTDIAKAWEVVEKVGLCVDYQTNTAIVSKNGIVMARAFSDAPLAICRAAIKQTSPQRD